MDFVVVPVAAVVAVALVRQGHLYDLYDAPWHKYLCSTELVLKHLDSIHARMPT